MEMVTCPLDARCLGAGAACFTQYFREQYRPDLPEADKADLWARCAPFIGQNSDRPEDPPAG